MTLDDFRASHAPPADAGAALQALWWAGKNDWEKAHKIVMSADGADAAWVHAYLHRVEGDLPNARYWYRHAGHHPASGPLDAEWAEITQALLARR